MLSLVDIYFPEVRPRVECDARPNKARLLTPATLGSFMLDLVITLVTLRCPVPAGASSVGRSATRQGCSAESFGRFPNPELQGKASVGCYSLFTAIATILQDYPQNIRNSTHFPWPASISVNYIGYNNLDKYTEMFTILLLGASTRMLIAA